MEATYIIHGKKSENVGIVPLKMTHGEIRQAESKYAGGPFSY